MPDENDPDENEEDLWGFATRDVKPLAREKALSRSKAPAPKPKARSKAQAQPPAEPPMHSLPDAPKRQPDPGTGLDHKTAEKLRKGKMPLEARLDLHGMSQAAARSALQAFILQAHSAGKRCVLVITGKGPGEGGRRDPLSSGQGVLKRMVPEWLQDGALKPLILKTETARPQHGGEGAIYVLLRRKRG